MVNITGHGWRKLMRATQSFSYVIENIPTPQPVFDFIQKKSGNSDEEMYGNFNMGAGFAIFLPKRDVFRARTVAGLNYKMSALDAGEVQEGPRQVIIQPKNLTYLGESLEVR
mgnify:FL=1